MQESLKILIEGMEISSLTWALVWRETTFGSSPLVWVWRREEEENKRKDFSYLRKMDNFFFSGKADLVWVLLKWLFSLLSIIIWPTRIFRVQVDISKPSNRFVGFRLDNNCYHNWSTLTHPTWPNVSLHSAYNIHFYFATGAFKFMHSPPTPYP